MQIIIKQNFFSFNIFMYNQFLTGPQFLIPRSTTEGTLRCLLESIASVFVLILKRMRQGSDDSQAEPVTPPGLERTTSSSFLIYPPGKHFFIFFFIYLFIYLFIFFTDHVLGSFKVSATVSSHEGCNCAVYIPTVC